MAESEIFAYSMCVFFFLLHVYSICFTYCKNKIAGISRSVVEASPAYYIMKIQSFSLLTNNSIERYESGKFEAGGHKWYTFRCSC
jgi:hypothetical protein